MSNTIKKNQKAEVKTKSGNSYSYKYVDIAQIHDYLESINAKYIQCIDRLDGDDYIMTKRCFDDEWEEEWLRGSKVVDATLFGNDNPAQKQGSALTYARRYSLLMAFGLATEDDENILNEEIEVTEEKAKQWVFPFGQYKNQTMSDILVKDQQYVEWFINNKAKDFDKQCYELLIKVDSNKKPKSRAELSGTINRLLNEKGILPDKVSEHFGKTSSEMSEEDLQEVIDWLEVQEC